MFKVELLRILTAERMERKICFSSITMIEILEIVESFFFLFAIRINFFFIFKIGSGLDW